MSASTVVQTISAVLLALLVVAGSAAGAERESLIVNGDFEEGTGADVPGWFRAFYPQREGIGNCINRSEARAKSGQWSLKMDTGPVLGEEVTLVFNGSVSTEAGHPRDRTLALSGWVYVEAGTALRPISMRLRAFGKDAEGKGIFLGDVLRTQVLGKPGKWVPFRAEGTVGYDGIANMDLHCSLRPDTVQTVQSLDDLRVEPVLPPPLQLHVLRDAVWRDEPALPVDVQLQRRDGNASLVFRLLNARGEEVRQWDRPPRAGIVGLAMPEVPLLEGSYLLRGELRDEGGRVLASAQAPLEVAASPWEDAPRMGHKTDEKPPPKRKASGPT